jgi:hypothetical protein
VCLYLYRPSSDRTQSIYNANFRRRLLSVHPAWNPVEITAAAREIHHLTNEDAEVFIRRYSMFGGIARSVLQHCKEEKSTLEAAFTLTDVYHDHRI